MIDLSVILPVYNAENYLENCISSILEAYKRTVDFTIEINIIDDGSTDGSVSIVNEFTKKYSFINLRLQKNQGVYVARNIGLSKAIGKYIWFVDADDTITQNSLKLIEDKLRISTAEIVHFPYVQEIAIHKFKLYDLDSNFKINESISGLSFLEFNDGRLYLWTNIYKRNFLNQNKLGFTGKIRSLEDSLFNIKAFYFAKHVEFIHKPLYEYRINVASISRKHTQQKLEMLKQSTYFVHSQMQVFLKSLKPNQRAYTIVQQKLSHSVLGFFYSLLAQKYEQHIIVKALKDYKKLKLYPVHSKEKSVKGKLFQKVLNKPNLYLMLCKVYKLFKKR